MPRLNVLTFNEQHAFDNPPIFSAEARLKYFTISNQIKNILVDLKTPTTKVGFFFLLPPLYHQQQQNCFLAL